MLAKLMLAKSPKAPKTDLGDLPTLLGRYFQIRDDYQNLISPDVSTDRQAFFFGLSTQSAKKTFTHYMHSTSKPKASAKTSTKANTLYR